jgi:hypothetical protein
MTYAIVGYALTIAFWLGYVLWLRSANRRTR